MKLIVGLGNPGKKFARTRHNTGHLFISKIKKQKAKIGDQVKIHKTSVFMNDSGEEIKKLLTINHLPFTSLLVVHDDMDLPLGDFKLQFGRSAAGHKGVQSVIDVLGTQDFWRLRIGIGKPSEGVTAEGFVLSRFSKQELKVLEKVFAAAADNLLAWVSASSQSTSP